MKRSLQTMPEKSILDADDVIHDLTSWRQTSSIFMFKKNCHIFRNTGRIF